MKKTNLVIIAIAIIVIVVVSSLQADKNRDMDKEEIVDYKPSAKKSYFYVDRYEVLHASLKCPMFRSYLNEYAGDRLYYAIQFIDKEELRLEHFHDYCANCIDDAEYESIQKIVSNSNGLNWGREDKEIDW